MQLGCDLGQDYHLARPMDPDALERLLATQPRVGAEQRLDPS